MKIELEEQNKTNIARLIDLKSLYNQEHESEDTLTELESEALSIKIDLAENKILTINMLLESLEDLYSNVYTGQIGNGHYIGHSNTYYQDYIYGEGENNEDVVIAYTYNKTGNCSGNDFVQEFWKV